MLFASAVALEPKHLASMEAPPSSTVVRDQLPAAAKPKKEKRNMINPECYVVTKRTYGSGIFDDSVDATFIITIVGSDRMQQAQEQLDFIVPTKDVYIVYNSPAPECQKELVGHPVEETYQDLTHAYIYVVQHAALLNYKGRVLILEDDFVWHPRLADPAIQGDLNTFLDSNNPRLYALGAVWGFAFPAPWLGFGSLKHIWINERAGSHALVISNDTRMDLLSMRWSSQRKWDIDEILTSYGGMYMYWEPLCVQCLTNTKNSNTYKKELSVARQLLVDVGLRFYNILGIDSHCTDPKLASKWDNVYMSLFAIHMSVYVVLIGLFVFLLANASVVWRKQAQHKEPLLS